MTLRDFHYRLLLATSFAFSFPLEIFVELRPGIVILEHPGYFDFGGQLGFRFGW